MHESAVDDTAKRTSKVGTMSRLHGHEHDAMQCNAIRLKRKTCLGKHLSGNTTTSSKVKELVLHYKSLFNYFSLKYFLYKVLLNLFRKDQAYA